MRARVLAAAVALLVLVACASRLRGEVSYDDRVDFSRYRSFALAPGDSGTPAARLIAEREVRRALEAKGLREVELHKRHRPNAPEAQLVGACRD